MPNRSIHTYPSKLFKRTLPLRWMRSALAALARRLLADSDTTARQFDWEVTTTRWGLGRGYRDRRFDGLAACGTCAGRGSLSQGNRCGGCGGTGRVTVRPADEPPTPSRDQA
jgi:hypothetical protein